jgi:valyl-tRNA synthetase
MTASHTELPKTYDPAAVESEAYQVWINEKCFHAEPDPTKNPFAIVIPPPNVTAALHLGHALNNTLQDILTRWRRMAGDNAVWLPGTDHAGIATQTVVEKRVMQEEGKRRTDFPRDVFVAKIQAWKDEYERKITDQLKAMGCSCDFDRQAFTMDAPRAKAVREAFFQLFKDGLIYRGKRLVNWDPVTQTALADDEVEMEDVDGFFYYMRYPLVEIDGQITHVTVATTRPETMLGDTAVAINPKDPRAAALRGRHVRLPIVNRVIPIIEDDYVVLPNPESDDAKAKYASGFLKVTPAHDPNDWEIGRRHNLAVINVMAPDAAISDKHGWTDVGDAGFVLGKSREEARKLIVEWFKEKGLLEEVKPYRHAVGHSYRSHSAIEPYLSDQWYCKVTDPRLSGAALRAMVREQNDTVASNGPPLSTSSGAPGEGRGEGPSAGMTGAAADKNQTLTPALSRSTGRGSKSWEGNLRFYPARYAKTFQSWHENIRDWAISRQLWWGHRIPVWQLSGDKQVPPDRHFWDRLSTLGQWIKEHRVAAWLGEGSRIDESGNIVVNVNDERDDVFICIRSPADNEVIEALEAFGFIQDPDVLDTWFSSALWPISTLNWPDDTPELRTWNPSNVLCTAREIITLWVSRMVMFNLYFRDCLPFRDVFIHAMIQDGEGQKMSKSLGNGVDPLDIIHSHGADAMRYILTAMTTQTQDLRMPVDLVDPHSGQAFAPVKITNSAGYVVAAPIQTSPKDPTQKMVSSYGMTSGTAKPTPETPLAKNTSSKFDSGRNLCNKIWNACRFTLSNLQGAPTEPVDERKWSMADRWIVARFNRTVEAVDAALSEYRFDVYAKACYDFFWGDLCDWYVEAIKPAMKDPARAGQTASVLASVLDGALRLMHPMIPFITETIWWRLNDVRPQRGLPGRIDCPPSERLVLARWPGVGNLSEAGEVIFPRLQAIIGVVRNLRNEYNVKPNQTVAVSILAPGDLAQSILGSREMIELLATCTLKDVRGDLPPLDNAARASAAGCEVYVEGLVDEAAERQRKQKQSEALTKKITALRGRLSNEAYTAKAPPHLVQQSRDELAQAEAELAKSCT